ncbi:MAG: DUF3619 family protein [Clostridia bacterium]
MNEPLFGNKVRHLLNQGLRINVKDEAKVASRLRAARQLALSRQKPESQGALAWAGNVVGGFGGWAGVSLRVVLPTLMLAAGVAWIYTWQQNQRLAEVEEIDAQLLTDDLPVEAYLDRGFQNYLQKTSAEQ